MAVTSAMIKNWREDKMIEEDGEVWIQAKDLSPGDILLSSTNLCKTKMQYYGGRFEVQRVTLNGHVVQIWVILEHAETGLAGSREETASYHPFHWVLVEV